MKKIGILGSTGSVGTQTLEVIDRQAEKYKVLYLTAKSNAELLCKQAKKYNVEAICILDKSKYSYCKNKLSDIKIFIGRKGLLKIASINKIDLMINALVGGSGMEPTVNAIRSGVDIALSNKESMVMAGSYINKLCKNNNVNIFPMDSEHSAIWQCLKGEQYNQINKLILTGSGGPFRTKSIKDFRKIKKEDALKHPNWEMGRKITIDSATMMNKGFEMIEAFWLFNIDSKNIEIVVHPQSIIHSMVEYIDGSIKAQLSNPDMKLPIQYAFSYPERYEMNDLKFNIKNFSRLDIEPVDLDKFKCIKLSYDAINKGGSNPTILNVANDIAVDLFLNKKITFIQIPAIIEECINNHSYINLPTLSDILSLTKWTKNYINERFVS